MQSIPELLKRHERTHKPWYRRWSVVGSIGVHVGLTLAIFVGPSLFVTVKEPPQFVSIQIVPAAALGQNAPPPPEEAAPPPPSATPPPAVRETPAAQRTSSKSRQRNRPAQVIKRQAATPTPIEASPVVRSRSTDAPPPRQGSPKGSPMATGTASEVSGFDDPDFTYGYYPDLMLSRLRAAWQRPPLGGEVEMVVHFRILADGRVDRLKILRSSGYISFDRAGLQAVQNAKMPPLPKSYLERYALPST